MRRNKLRSVILFGSVVMLGLLVVQGFWMKKAFDINERQLNHSIQVALKNVADSIIEQQGTNGLANTEVKQLSTNFFFAELNIEIQPEKLEELLSKELGSRNIMTGYEFGIYRASDDTLVYGEYVPATIRWQFEHPYGPETDVEGERSNFAVYFPNKFSAVIGEMKIWIFSSVVLLLMLTFFVYAILNLLKERKLSEIKEDFINNLTHEFKTPIANIELASQALQQGKIDEHKKHRYFHIIQSENSRLKSQVERILQLGALDKEQLSLDKEEIDVHQLLHNLGESIDMRVQQKQGSLQLDLQAESAKVYGDDFHLTNSVFNVLDNAEKYSDGKPEISVSTKNEKDGLLITIRDKGIGIKQEFQQMIFDKFFRVPNGNVHNVKGFGLGLSYVKTIIEAHRGSISIQSVPDQGSQFDIFLPINS